MTKKQNQNATHKRSAARIKKVMRHFGAENQRELAKILGISEAYVSELMTGKKQPGAVLCFRVEKISGGMITADQLRPDLF